MEYLILVLIGVSLCLKNYCPSEESASENIVLETRLNPNFYEDEDAFMEVAHALGFNSSTCSASCRD